MQNNTKHIVRLAQQQALTSFAELVAQMLMETNARIGSAVRGAAPAEQAALNAARNWLSDFDRSFRASMQTTFSTLLERAMETMHTDLRAGLRDIRADKLSLVEDETITRQIELDRVVARLRDVDEMSLGRINLTIASLHGVSQVRERENPFRPYLVARALYESVRATMKEEHVAKVLFEHMAGAMAELLPGYYATVLGHFEARGIDARLLARPSDMTRAQRDMLNAQYGSVGADRVHGLQQLVREVLEERKTPAGSGLAPDAAAQNAAPSSARAASPQRSWIDVQLRQMQQAPQGAVAPSPMALCEQLGARADAASRATIDLVGMVFNYILCEERMPSGMRAVLGRLQVPFLRAALLDPELLHRATHPARSLLDRLGTLAAAMLPGAGALEPLHGEAAKLVEQVRQSFDADVLVFATTERELDGIVDTMLQRAEPRYARLCQIVMAAESDGAQSAAVLRTLKGLLAPLAPDPRLAAFIDTVWIKVMLHQGSGAIDASLLPELIWSTQAKPAPADRSVLMRALPGLVRRVRDGIALLGMPEAESKAALDQLAGVHMDVLGQRLAAGGPSTSVDWLHVHLAPLSAAGAASIVATAQLPAGAVEAVLEQHGMRARVFTEPAVRDAMPADEAWLAHARPGANFETLIDGCLTVVRLDNVSADQSLFVFSTPAPALPLVYRTNALLAAMHAGAIRPVEYAPLFERAVSAAMAGLGAPAPG